MAGAGRWVDVRTKALVLSLISFCAASCSGAGSATIDDSRGREAGVASPTTTHPSYDAFDGGAAVTGAVGPDGGSVSRLYFAVVGDTRPAAKDDTGGYPTAVISKIYMTMGAITPRPTFAVSTGDYQFTST